ncbi:MAG: hypothetical protein HFH86_05200 [Bacilli bacterium]|nr:hypothetical protein [Bacilli bacterium]
MKDYLNIFIDKDYPSFIDKYLTTDTLNRLKFITQFCGCDYTKLYSPLFFYTRYDHSIVVAHMTWHFTHNKKETIAALLHDIGTPCFAHCIDYVFGDYINQESSEKKLSDMAKKDKVLLSYLKEDDISLVELEDISNYHILENKSPKLCTDRLDGVLHTCYIWLHTHTLEQIKEVYYDITVLKNEDGNDEIGFKSIEMAEKFVSMVYNYAKELQGNVDKYVMKFVSEIVKLSVEKGLITLEDLYTKKETDICKIFYQNFSSWRKFNNSNLLIRLEEKPLDTFYISFDTKKRNTVPLVKYFAEAKRILDCSSKAQDFYDRLEQYTDSKFAYILDIKELN